MVDARPLLSDQDREMLASCGALRLRAALLPEIGELEVGFERAWAGRERRRAGGRQAAAQFLDLDPSLAGLRSHTLINHLQAELVAGTTLAQVASTGNLHAGDTPWHVDGVGIAGPQIRVNFYLDPVRRGKGCLLVVPGSHRFAGLQMAGPVDRPAILPLPNWYDGSIGSIALESDPGDVIIIDRRVIHAALGGHHRRRMFNLDLAEVR